MLAKGTSTLSIGGEEPPPLNEPVAPSKQLPSGVTALRRHVEHELPLRWENAFDHGRVRDKELARLDDIEYLRYRAATLLVHQAWQLRNEAVKLTGLLRNTSQLPLILHLLTDRTPAPLYQRILGGDYQQVGFIRRNALGALSLIGEYDKPQVQQAVAEALIDPYYEVRSAAMRLVRRFARSGAKISPELVQRVIRTEDKNLEVRWEALHTVGVVAEPEEVLDACRPFALAPQAPVRDAVLRAYLALIERFPKSSKESWYKELIGDLDRFTITSVAFHPFFPLKERYAALRKRLREENE